MIEVFKTNVTQSDQANRLLDRIHETFDGYTANFDLEDCDCILRVRSNNGFVASDHIIFLLRESGFDAEILPDEDYMSNFIETEFRMDVL